MTEQLTLLHYDNYSSLRNSDLEIYNHVLKHYKLTFFFYVLESSLRCLRPTQRCLDSYTGKHTVYTHTEPQTHLNMLINTPPTRKFKNLQSMPFSHVY